MLCGFSVFSAVGFMVCHFGLSALVGWLVFWLMSIILSHTGLKAFAPRVCTLLLPLLAALSCSVLVHVVEDYTLHLF